MNVIDSNSGSVPPGALAREPESVARRSADHRAVIGPVGERVAAVGRCGDRV
jgi:hypothetical protein